jgi:hypothetical protein
MKIGTIKTIVKEELSKYEELPKWVDPLLVTLNKFINDIGLALKGNLSFEDNFNCKIKQIKLTHGVEQAINPQSTSKVKGVLLMGAGGVVVDKFGWRFLTTGQIGVTVYFNSGTSSICDLVILF